MNKLNICLVSLTVAPDSTDGEAKVIRALFDYLRKQGHHVKLITGKWEVDLHHPDIIQVDLVTKRFLWLPQFILKVSKYLKNHQFDIIHANSPKATIPVLLARKKKFISYIHDLGTFEFRLTSIPVEKYLTKYVTKKATLITTVSKVVKKQFKTFMPKTNLNKIFNLYNGIDEKFKPYPKEAKELKEKLKLKGPVLLYVGRITPYKGVEDIIEAYKIAKKEISDLNLVIGGKPDYSMKKSYKEWVQKHKDINFVGFIPDTEIPYYYTMAEIFLTYSNASEGFGLTIAEAIACGTPVICSSLNVFKEVLEDNAVFVPLKNPEALSKEIIGLLNNTSKQESIVKNGQLFIKRYSWDAVGKRLEEVYNTFLSK